MHNSKRTRFYIYTMTPRLSDNLKMQIVSWYFEEPIENFIVGQIVLQSLYLKLWVCNYHTHGLVTNPFSNQTGRPTKINGGDVEYISSLTARCHVVAHFILLTTLTQITNKNPSLTIKYLNDP